MFKIADNKYSRPRILQKSIVDNPYDDRWAPHMGMDSEDISLYMREQMEIVGDQLVPSGNPQDGLRKAAFTTADTGTFANIFGPIATLQLANQQTVISALPKRGYERHGFRARSARFQNSATGSTEGDALPSSAEATYNEVPVGLKDLVVSTEQSFRWLVVIDKNDGITFDAVGKDFVNDFYFATNADLLGDVDTTANLNIESIDRYTQASTARAAIGYTDGDEDMWGTSTGIDRSGNTWFNSYVNHNSDTDRELTINEVNKIEANVYTRWGSDRSNKVYITGADIHNQWSMLEGAKKRINEQMVSFSYGAGIQPIVGQAGGFKLTTYDGHPILLDESVADTGRRIYLMDLNTCGIATGRPLQIYRGDNIVYLNAVKQRQAIYWIAEFWGTLASACGQARDFSTGW